MDFERKKMVSQVHEVDASCVSPEFNSSQGIETWLIKAILILSLLIALALLSLHQPSGNGKSLVFDAFVICVIFSFTASFSWLLMGNKTKLATFSRCYSIMSMIFMASALSILACALFSENFRLSYKKMTKLHIVEMSYVVLLKTSSDCKASSLERLR
ncbi:hypothetical protein JRO89_XS03G0027400 [Xanthoceras sorbifolium]|uniref:NADH-plastoquinone oxidoreductase subunit 6 n=1 Tax=Xanthoceras sorbifolium TaxID=99658 RepID=A0ABQ8I8S2_9ROSI|nr:hypothetical protein JRO89_XS03G0027400 [Xanthoceras sorbifolium]